MLNMIKGAVMKYASVGMLSIIVAAGLMILSQKSTIAGLTERNDELVAQVTQLKTNLQLSIDTVSQLNLTIDELQDSIAIQKVEQQRLNAAMELIEQEKRKTESDLRKAIGRQDTVWKKPTLVERMVVRSWNDFTDRVSCTTGATERCE